MINKGEHFRRITDKKIIKLSNTFKEIIKLETKLEDLKKEYNNIIWDLKMLYNITEIPINTNLKNYSFILDLKKYVGVYDYYIFAGITGYNSIKIYIKTEFFEEDITNKTYKMSNMFLKNYTLIVKLKNNYKNLKRNYTVKLLILTKKD